MDQGTLVIEQINAGAEFINRLDKHIRVRTAFWLRAADQSSWYLYIASDQVNDNTMKTAYTEVARVARAMNNPNLEVFRIRPISLSDPLAQAASDVHKRFAARVPLHAKERIFGDVYADEVYVYPPPIFHPPNGTTPMTNNKNDQAGAVVQAIFDHATLEALHEFVLKLADHVGMDQIEGKPAQEWLTEQIMANAYEPLSQVKNLDPGTKAEMENYVAEGGRVRKTGAVRGGAGSEQSSD
jgi:hypothetical protein